MARRATRMARRATRMARRAIRTARRAMPPTAWHSLPGCGSHGLPGHARPADLAARAGSPRIAVVRAWPGGPESAGPGGPCDPSAGTPMPRRGTAFQAVGRMAFQAMPTIAATLKLRRPHHHKFTGLDSTVTHDLPFPRRTCPHAIHRHSAASRVQSPHDVAMALESSTAPLDLPVAETAPCQSPESTLRAAASPSGHCGAIAPLLTRTNFPCGVGAVDPRLVGRLDRPCRSCCRRPPLRAAV